MSMPRTNSRNSLMGFSVHQPAIGAPLQFFPAMGSQQLDEMIDAYVPGDISILEKRAAVSMEFFEYSMTTGDLFKFFMVYPTPASANTSPTMDSGYYSGLAASPVMSETQWASTSSRMTSPSSSRKATSANDFSNLPGMKIMTKDGRDVTNSASRGCKTKEQRDHAHLMRIIKACDSCRRKKTKCDPSHKRPAAGTSSGKVTKKTSKNTRPAAAPPQIAAKEASTTLDFDQMLSMSSSSLDSFLADSLVAPTDGFSMEWDQFVQYDEEPSDVIPYDYDFLLDPAGYFSPATTASFSSSSTSPSQQPITPIDRDVHITDDTTVGHDHKPILPYLNPGGLEAGDNYLDFNLYSPESSCLDEELGLAMEVAASPIQSQKLDRHRYRQASEGAAGNAAGRQSVHETHGHGPDNEATDSYRRGVILDIEDGLRHDTSDYTHEWSRSSDVLSWTASEIVVTSLPHATSSSNGQATTDRAAVNAVPTGYSIVDNVLEGVTSDGLYGRETIPEQRSSSPLFDRGRLRLHSLSIQDPAVNVAAVPQERQLLLQGSLDSRSVDDGAQSTPSLPYWARSCGQNGLISAERAAMTRSTTVAQTTDPGTQGDAFVRIERASVVEPELNISQGRVQHVTTYRAFSANTLSPLPPPTPSPYAPGVAMPDCSNVRSASGSPGDSFQDIPMEKQTIGLPGSAILEQTPAGLARESTITRNSGTGAQYPTNSMQNLSKMPSQPLLPTTTLTAPVIASLSALAVAMSLASLGMTITKDNGLVQNLQPAALSRYVTAVLLLSFWLSTSSSLVSVFPICVLSFMGYTHLLRYGSSAEAAFEAPHSSSSHKLPLTKQLLRVTNGFKATRTKALCLV